MSKSLWITTSWDDGHPLDLRLADLLEKHAVPGTFYVPMESERGTLSPENLRELATRFEVGGHTVRHLDLTALSDEDAWAEIVGCRERLESATGKACTAFCFPRGKFRLAHFEQVRQAGFSVARTVELLSLAPPRRHDGIMVMPTSVQVFSHTRRSYGRNLAKRLAVRNFCRHWFALGNQNWLAATERMLRIALERGGVLHLWGHSWEIEETGQWENLDRALAMLGALHGRANFGSNSEVAAHAREL